MDPLTIGSFFFFTALVGWGTYWLTRRADHASCDGFFLAGRSLTFPWIAGSLLLTNLSTEQLVGLNGAGFQDGLCVMVWEVVAVVALVAMALFFLPRFLRSGVTTVPEYLELRFDHGTQVITNLIFLVAYVVILLPIILYTGATGMIGAMDLHSVLVGWTQNNAWGMNPETITLWVIVWVVGLLGAVYALFGGLRTVAVSDTLNGIGLLTGGLLITVLALRHLGGEAGVAGGLEALSKLPPGRFNSIGGAQTSVPFTTLFSGIFLLHLFYWTTNQQIIQRTFGARSLAEGQKGVLLTGMLKLLGPLYLVLPGILAFAVFEGQAIKPDHAYGRLVRLVLPGPLNGFFAAAMIGAILSSFNSALNSSCTLFSLGLYKSVFRPKATDEEVVRSSQWFGWIVTVTAMGIAPLLANTTSIFGFMQKMNGIYFIPIFSVVLVGMLTRRVPPLAAKLALITGFVVIAVGYFVYPFNQIVQAMHEFQFLGLVFSYLVIMMLVVGELRPAAKEWVQKETKAIDLTPWRYVRLVSLILVAIVIGLYAAFADFRVLTP
jgi:SSS family solute:Na+ symporter